MLASIISSTALHAQTPQYFRSNFDGVNVQSWATFNTIDNKIQCIYYPSDFPGMPKGVITAVYLRAYDYFNDVTYKNLRLSLGYTNSANYPNIGGVDTFKTGLTPVFNRPSYFIPGSTTVKGAWVKFSASVSWTYDPTKNTVLDIQHGSEGQQNFGGFSWMNLLVGAKRIIADRKDAITRIGGALSNYMDLGFDIQPLGVDDFQNLTSLGVFPNPSTDGHFMVSADAKQAIQRLMITVRNSVGQVVYETSYLQPGGSLFKEVVLPRASPGIYFVEILADGERHTRRITLQ